MPEMGLTRPLSKFIPCPDCGIQVSKTHLDRHRGGSECNIRKYIKGWKKYGWYDCSTQLVSLFERIAPNLKYSVEYRLVTAHENKLGLDLLFVKGRPGLLAQNLTAKPLAWALKQLEDQEFRSAFSAAVLMSEDKYDANYLVTEWVISQWQNRKGSHKNKKVRGRRVNYRG